MATQTVVMVGESELESTQIGVYVLSTDSLVAIATAQEINYGGGVYSAAFTDITAGDYRLKLFSNGEVNWIDFVALTLSTATFVAAGAIPSAGGGGGPTASQIADEVQTRTIARVTLVDTATNLTNLPTIPVDWITNSGIASSAISEIQSGLATQVSIDIIDDFLDTEIAAIKSKTDNLPAAPASTSDIPSAATVASTVWANATRTLSAGTNIVLAKGTGLTGLNDLDAAGIRSAVGLASANLDTQLTTIDDFLDTEVAAIKTKTDFLPSATAGSAGGLFIAGTNAATTITTGLTTTFTGNLTGSVGSVTGAVVLDSAERNTLVDLVWDEAMSGHTTAGTYGGRIVRATNSNTEVQITGSNHIAADVHEFQSGVITAGDFAANAITASALATDAVTEIQSGLATQASVNIIDDFLDTEVAAIKAKTDNLPATPASTSDIPSASTVASTVWSNGVRTLSAGTNIVLAKGTGVTGFNDLDAAGIRSSVGLSGANLDTQLSTIDDFLDTEISAIKSKTDNLPATPASTSDIPSTSSMASAVWSNVSRTLSAGTNIVLAKGVGVTGFNDLDAAGVRSALGMSSANMDTQLASIVSYIDTEIAAIKAKTDNLPLDPADASDIAASFSSLSSALATIASYIDTEVAAIKAKTDNLPATPASTSDIPSASSITSAVWSNASRTLSAGTNIVLAKGVGVTGFNDLDAGGMRSAIGLASANLDTQLTAIDDFLDTEISAIKAKTDNLPTSPAAVSNIPTVVQIRQEMDSNSVKLSEIKALTILGSGDQTSADFSNDYYNAIADAVLTRNISNVEDTLEEHTLGGAIMGQLEWSLDGSGNLIVYKTDGTTELYTKVVNSTTSDGNVITGLE